MQIACEDSSVRKYAVCKMSGISSAMHLLTTKRRGLSNHDIFCQQVDSFVFYFVSKLEKKS